MELQDYFEPMPAGWEDVMPDEDPFYLGRVFRIHTQFAFPDLEGVKVAILGAPEERGSKGNFGCSEAPLEVMKQLFQLKQGGFKIETAFLGNLKPGESLNDTYVALSEIIATLIKKDIIPLILGGSQDLTYAQYTAYKNLEQTVNIVSIDSKFDLGNIEEEISSDSYLGKIILHQPSFLFNYSNIGYQSYYVGAEATAFMDRLYFDTYRVGQVRASIDETEPIIRNADMLTFDLGSVRHSDAPGNKHVSPNGFYGEEVCQIMRYAGLSDKLSCVGFYELNPTIDRYGQSSALVAQMIWYFLEGVFNRKNDLPLKSKSNFIRYTVNIRNSGHELIFYKSKKTDRWWMEVPYHDNNSKYKRHHLVPCSYHDYVTACDEEIPERWWQAFHKLS